VNYTTDDMIVISRTHAEDAVERARWRLWFEGFAAGAGAVVLIYFLMGK
jgi:hypothetical protein